MSYKECMELDIIDYLDYLEFDLIRFPDKQESSIEGGE